MIPEAAPAGECTMVLIFSFPPPPAHHKTEISSHTSRRNLGITPKQTAGATWKFPHTAWPSRDSTPPELASCENRTGRE